MQRKWKNFLKMKKIQQIDLTSDRLVSLASDLTDEHNYTRALKMLNKNSELYFDDEDTFALYAGIFDDLQQYESCINFWFRFLDERVSGDLEEAYEGMALSYLNLGEEQFAAYYYNEMLIAAGGVSREEREQIVKKFMLSEENPLKTVYPPEKADFSDEIERGIELMKESKPDEAVAEFEKVDCNNPQYFVARNYIAMCHIMADRNDEAERECNALLERFGDDVQVLTTLAAVKSEQKKTEEGRLIAQRLLSLCSDDSDDIYKIATVCCENGMHKEAYDLFCKLDGKLLHDKNVLYFKAVSAFNCGRHKESLEAFDTLVTLYPRAVTARYWYDHARELSESDKEEELSYIYTLPDKLRESTLTTIVAVQQLSARECRKLFKEMDISQAVYWCFDEINGRGLSELQFVAAECAIKACLDETVRELLLDAFLPDGLKIFMITKLTERNDDNNFGVVLCHMYKSVDTYKLDIGRQKRKMFVGAYARLTAHFCVIDNDYGEEFMYAAEKLYSELSQSGRLSSLKDHKALTAAIFVKSGVKIAGLDSVRIAEMFDTSENQIKKVLGE